MRVAPIGLILCDDPFAYGVMAAALTHGHPSGYLAAGAYAQIISELLYGSFGMPLSLRHAVVLVFERPTIEAGHEEPLASLQPPFQLSDQPGPPSPARAR